MGCSSIYMTRYKNSFLRTIKENGNQLEELKSIQFNGSSNNFSGSVIVADDYIFIPSALPNINEGFSIIIESTTILLCSIIVSATYDDNTEANILSNTYLRKAVYKDNKFYNIFNFYGITTPLPRLNIKAYGIVSNYATITVERSVRA